MLVFSRPREARGKSWKTSFYPGLNRIRDTGICNLRSIQYTNETNTSVMTGSLNCHVNLIISRQRVEDHFANSMFIYVWPWDYFCGKLVCLGHITLVGNTVILE